MGGFAKLFSSIVTSSIWGEKDSVRVVWITLLALCNRDGLAEASVGGLARSANVSREACEEALEVLSSPDPDDRSGVAEGRRIERAPGGWRLLNYPAYREKGRSQDRKPYLARKKQESRARLGRTVNHGQPPSTTCQPLSTTVNPNQPIAEAEAEAEAEKKSGAPLALPPALDTPEFRQAWADWQAYRREAKFPAWKSATVKAKLAELAGWGSERAVKAIRLSISNGWRGLFDRDDVLTPPGLGFGWRANSDAAASARETATALDLSRRALTARAFAASADGTICAADRERIVTEAEAAKSRKALEAIRWP